MKIFFIIFIFLIIEFTIVNCEEGIIGNRLVSFNKIQYETNKIIKIFTIEPNYLRWVSSIDGEIKGINLMEAAVELSDPFNYRDHYFGYPVIGTEYSYEKLVNPSMLCEDKYFNLVGMMNYIVKNKTSDDQVFQPRNSKIKSHTDQPPAIQTPSPNSITIESFPNVTLLTMESIKIEKILNEWGKGSEISSTFRKTSININPLEAEKFPKSFDHENNLLYIIARERLNPTTDGGGDGGSNRRNFIVVYNSSSNSIIEKEIVIDLIFETIVISGFNKSIFIAGQKQNSYLTYLYQVNYNDQIGLSINLLQTIPFINYQQVVCENSRFLILYSNFNHSIIKIDLLNKYVSSIIETEVPIVPIENSKIMAVAYVDNYIFDNFKTDESENIFISQFVTDENNGNDGDNYQEKKEKLSNDAKLAIAITIPFAGFLIALGITIFIIIKCKRIKKKNRVNNPEIKINNPNEEFENTGADSVVTPESSLN
ncbi:hypothetical protein ACTFIW_004579 [Dictyostelium discoideum]